MAALALLAGVMAEEGVEITPRVFEFLLSPWDHSDESVIQYALRTVLTELVTVPGSGSTEPTLPRAPDTIRRGLPALLLLLRRWFDCILALHRCDYSLRGNFTAASFVLVAGFQVKIPIFGGILLCHYTRHSGGLDYSSFADSVEYLLTLQEDVPPYIQVWLELIREGVNGEEYRIRYHTALMEGRQAIDFVLEGRRVLEQLRVINPHSFHMIIWFHPDLMDWNIDSNCVNSYMADARLYEDPRTGQPFNFPRDLTGALALVRNCHAHPARYLADYMVLILEDDFRGLVARFQESIFRAGLLRLFRLEITMA